MAPVGSGVVKELGGLAVIIFSVMFKTSRGTAWFFRCGNDSDRFLMKIRGFKLLGTKAAAFAAILAVPLIASANFTADRSLEEVPAFAASGPATQPSGQDLSGRVAPVALANVHVDFKPAAPTQEAFVPESPTILASVLLLLPLGASAVRIIFKNRAARRHNDPAP